MLLLKDREIYVQPRAHTVHCCQEESMLPMFPMTPSSRWCKACRKCLMATSWSVLELWERKKFRKESWRMQEADKRSVEDSNCHLACNTMDMFSICQVPAISLRSWWGPKSEEVQVWLAVDSAKNEFVSCANKSEWNTSIYEERPVSSLLGFYFRVDFSGCYITSENKIISFNY